MRRCARRDRRNRRRVSTSLSGPSTGRQGNPADFAAKNDATRPRGGPTPRPRRGESTRDDPRSGPRRGSGSALDRLASLIEDDQAAAVLVAAGADADAGLAVAVEDPDAGA